MFLVTSKGTVGKSISMNLLKRFISSTRYVTSAKTSSTSNASNSEKRDPNLDSDIQSYRPLSENEIQKIINLDNIHIVTKSQQKRPQRQPLLLNFFIGKIDREMLTYPQVMDLKDFEEMAKRLSPLSDYFENNMKTPFDLRFRDISNEMLADFRSMKLFGSNVREKYGGRGYFKSEMTWASESEANDLKSFLVLAGHQLAVEAITDHGDENQHNQYLMEMAKGEIIGSTCLFDPLSNDGSITVSKTTTPHGDEYVLNGSASWVVCSQHANILVVVANKSKELKEYEADLEYDDDIDYDDPSLTFVLDASTHGITYEDQSKTIGCNQVPFTTVNFFNVRARKSEILSRFVDERHTSNKLLESSRIQMSTLNLIQSKRMLNHLINYTIQTRCFGEKLRDQEFILAALAQTALNIYALESMIYLSTGILDEYDNPKVHLETALTKAFSQDILKNVVEVSTNLLRTSATIAGYQIEEDIRNAVQLQALGGTSDALKKYVATKGLQHCADHFGKNVDNYKDSIFVKLGFDDPTILNISAHKRLGDFLHPSLESAANNLEESITRLQCAGEMLLHRYQDDALSHRNEIRTLGELAMQNYAMFASVGRASRSYCLGLRYGQYETVAAANYIFMISHQILNTVLGIKHSESGFQNSQKEVVERALDLHKRKLSPFLSVPKSGLNCKSIK